MPVLVLQEPVDGELAFLSDGEPRPVVGGDLHLDLHPGLAVDGADLVALLELHALVQHHIEVDGTGGGRGDGVLGYGGILLLDVGLLGDQLVGGVLPLVVYRGERLVLGGICLIREPLLADLREEGIVGLVIFDLDGVAGLRVERVGGCTGLHIDDGLLHVLKTVFGGIRLLDVDRVGVDLVGVVLDLVVGRGDLVVHHLIGLALPLFLQVLVLIEGPFVRLVHVVELGLGIGIEGVVAAAAGGEGEPLPQLHRLLVVVDDLLVRIAGDDGLLQLRPGVVQVVEVLLVQGDLLIAGVDLRKLVVVGDPQQVELLFVPRIDEGVRDVVDDGVDVPVYELQPLCVAFLLDDIAVAVGRRLRVVHLEEDVAEGDPVPFLHQYGDDGPRHLGLD